MIEAEMEKTMQSRRSRLETLNVILTLAVNGIRKTHIMYRANLSHRQLEKYLEILIEKQLLITKDGEYVTTSRGSDYIEKFKEIKSLMGEGDKVPLRHSINELGKDKRKG